MRASHSLQLLLASTIPGLALGAKGVMTTNSKAAASLQAAAVVPATGSYTFTSVATGEKLTYQAAVAYVCASGAGAEKTTLEQTKQWWLAVPIDKTSGTATASQNEMLIAAQGESVATREAKNKAMNDAFDKRDEVTELDIDDTELSLFDEELLTQEADEFTFTESEGSLEKRGHGRHHKHASKAAIARAKKARAAAAARAKKAKASTKSTRSVAGKVIGTYYIIPSDHLIDQATRALTAEVVMSRGIKTTAITAWKKGAKNQQWILTKN